MAGIGTEKQKYRRKTRNGHFWKEIHKNINHEKEKKCDKLWKF